MDNFKRNDKVYVLYPVVSRPKFSQEVPVPVGRKLVIKKVIPADEFSPFECCIVDATKINTYNWLPIGVQYLYKYTKIGELLYG